MSEHVTTPPSPRHLATGILGLIWIVYAMLLWVLIAIGPQLIPLSHYLPGLVITLAFMGGLLAARRWESVWRRTFSPTVGLPGWVILGGVATVIGATASSFVRPLPIAGLGSLAVFCFGCSYAAVAVSRRSRLRAVVPWPGWIVLMVAVWVAFILGGGLLQAGSPIAVVFLVALVLFTFYVLFILPLTLYQSMRDVAPPTPSALPAVSVLIPAYNEEGYVGECIESVLDSSYPEDRLEILVIDDGSTDGTYAEAAAYRDHGVTVLHRDNGGKHAALNFGLACSSSPVVVTVDADSRPAPPAIEQMVAALESDAALGALSAPVLALNDDSLLTGLQRIEYAISNTNRRAYSIFEAVPVVPGCMGVYRRQALEDVWGYDPDTVTEDFDLTVQLLKHGWTVRHGPGIVWTIVPDGWAPLWRQRLRWYQGSVETIRKHWDVFVTPRYRYLHVLSLPARLVSHLFTPAGSFIILGAVVWGFLTSPSLYLATIVLLFFLLTGLITLYSIVLEDEPLRELVYAPLFFIGYKHFIDCTIGVGSVRAFVGGRRW